MCGRTWRFFAAVSGTLTNLGCQQYKKFFLQLEGHFSFLCKQKRKGLEKGDGVWGRVFSLFPNIVLFKNGAVDLEDHLFYRGRVFADGDTGHVTFAGKKQNKIAWFQFAGCCFCSSKFVHAVILFAVIRDFSVSAAVGT